MNKLTTTEEMLHDLSVRIRMASYSAMDCSNHLAIHSSRTYAHALHTVAVRLSELAVVARDVGDVHDRSRPVQA